MTNKDRQEARYQRRRMAREEKRRRKLSEYDSLERVADGNSLNEAFQKSKKGVDWKASVQRYEMNLLKNISSSQKDILAGNDVSQGFICFILVERGKTRYIKSVHIRERVVQRSLCDNALVPVLQNSLIYDNGASMKGKGIHFALNELDKHLHRFYRDNGFSNEGYVVVIDFKGYFDNILHNPLYQKIEKKFDDGRIVILYKQLTRPFDDDVVSGEKPESEGKSLGIGSQVSQISAVSYPDVIDHYIKDECGMKYYGRYMDDSYILCKTKEEAHALLEELKKRYESLGIIVNQRKTQVVHLRHGFTFLKIEHRLTESGRIVKRPCRKSVTRQRRKLKKFKIKLETGKMTYEDIRSSYDSWKGHISYADSYKTIKNMDKLFNSLFIDGWENKGGKQDGKTENREQDLRCKVYGSGFYQSGCIVHGRSTIEPGSRRDFAG